MKRYYLVLLIIVSLVLAACQPVASEPAGDMSMEAAEPSGTVEVFSWWSGGGELAGLNAIIEVFNARYPEVEFDNAAIGGGDGVNMKTVLETRMLGGEPPDSFQVWAGVGVVEDHVVPGRMEGLDFLFSEEGLYDVFPQSVIDNVSYEGTPYVVPVNIHRQNIMWYRVDRFEAAGITEPPTTWDEFFVVAEQLKEAGIPAIGGASLGALAFHTYNYFLNSVVVTVGTVLISISIGCLAGYGLARYSGIAGVVILFAALAFRALPRMAFILPYYYFAQLSGLYDTFPLLIVTFVAINQPFTIWMLRSFFMEIPKDLEESAMVDGAGRLVAFARVIIPVMWPGIVATALFTLLLAYNEFLLVRILTQTNWTLPVAISRFTGGDEVWDTNWKLLVENFTEGYHTFQTHKDSLENVTPAELSYWGHQDGQFSAFYGPFLSDWSNFESWEERGSVDATRRANTIWKKILA